MNRNDESCFKMFNKKSPPSLKLRRARVEATRIELVSKHILQKLSTCLSRFKVSESNWNRTTDYFLSWIVLSNSHSLLLQQPVSF